ncbi:MULTISPECIES: hypothetical protein [unclassified Cryobacterium]|uniref:hypothetical protein n=1 Tax=unclassified Cryobacterium TaxID=2649013 RepID=UPI001068E884|nr:MULTISPECIES: hypothetical protein [unclassified Cryobacterium]TFC59879.1 hypothetical protein E3O60_07265 [Cryobacterium sp. TMB1-7]TFC91448.1 hypothetical protein E3T19_03925 [Cryobacterium sp. TMT4-31]
MSVHGTPTITAGAQWVLLILGGIVTVFVVLAAVWVVFSPRPVPTPAVDPDARPVPAAPAAAAAVSAPTAVLEPGTPKPAACEQIYSPTMVGAFGDLVLNPAWTTQPGADVRDGADDPELRAIINGSEHLSCRWVSPAGASDSGVSTSVVWVAADQTAAVEARLRALGMECYEELDGLRCITETTTDVGRYGQSHFLRGGIWLATLWVNAGPDGYTHDMVNTIWAGA